MIYMCVVVVDKAFMFDQSYTYAAYKLLHMQHVGVTKNNRTISLIRLGCDQNAKDAAVSSRRTKSMGRGSLTGGYFTDIIFYIQ